MGRVPWARAADSDGEVRHPPPPLQPRVSNPSTQFFFLSRCLIVACPFAIVRVSGSVQHVQRRQGGGAALRRDGLRSPPQQHRALPRAARPRHLQPTRQKGRLLLNEKGVCGCAAEASNVGFLCQGHEEDSLWEEERSVMLTALETLLSITEMDMPKAHQVPHIPTPLPIPMGPLTIP